MLEYMLIDETASRSAESLNALAYTVGNDIVFGEDKYDPSSNEGKRLIAHELVHVLQQDSKPSLLIKRHHTDENIIYRQLTPSAKRESNYNKATSKILHTIISDEWDDLHGALEYIVEQSDPNRLMKLRRIKFENLILMKSQAETDFPNLNDKIHVVFDHVIFLLGIKHKYWRQALISANHFSKEDIKDMVSKAIQDRMLTTSELEQLKHEARKIWADANRIVNSIDIAMSENNSLLARISNCKIDTPQDCSDYSDWLNSFPSVTSTGTTGLQNITTSMPAELQSLVTGNLPGGRRTDCADISIILRHFFLEKKNLPSSQLRIGRGVSDQEVRLCVVMTGTIHFQDQSNKRLVSFYKQGNKNVKNLKRLVDMGLKAGDLFIWKKKPEIHTSSFSGHAQTIQSVNKLLGTITIVQGSMESGVGLGIVQQKQQTFEELTGKDDGNAEIKDTIEENFFGAGPWR